MELVLYKILTACVFLWAVWGLAFLVADAHIFGCHADRIHEWLFPDDHCIPVEQRDTHAKVFSVGIVPLRPWVMERSRFFRELLSCYFCLGVWCGVAIHILLRSFFGPTYWLWHPHTPLGWSEGVAVAALAGAPLCYVLNLLVKLLEEKTSSPF